MNPMSPSSSLKRMAEAWGLIALLGSIVADFQFNSRVDLQLAINARDELQAEYNAMTAMRLRLDRQHS